MYGTIILCLLGVMCAICPAFSTILVYSENIPQTITEEFRDLPASFGGIIPDDGIRGLLVPGVPEDGCGPLNKPPAVDNFTGKWMVIVARYNCSFEVKVRNAQAAGYDLAIVHNVNSSDLVTMPAENAKDIIIPSVFVSDIAGAILSQEYIYPSSYFIMVNSDLPFDINTHLLLPFAIVSGLCLLVMVVFMIVKCIKDRRRARRHRLPHRSLKKIPIHKFTKGDPYETCAICLDDYLENEKLRVLPCAHAYHMKCIDPWLTQNRRVCPVCKRRVFAAGERRRANTDSDSDDTEPLVSASEPPVTQGGTFDEQSVNPFVRAAAFISRLRRNEEVQEPDTEAARHLANNEQTEYLEEVESDRRPLLEQAERRRRRRRRSRSAPRRSERRPAPQRAVANAPGSAPEEPASLRSNVSDYHSINGSPSQGEIGVAALPAPPDASSHHINL